MFAITRLLRADPQPTFLGMDLGTGSAKTVVTAASGSAVARAKVVTHHPAGARLLGVCATRSWSRDALRRTRTHDSPSASAHKEIRMTARNMNRIAEPAKDSS